MATKRPFVFIGSSAEGLTVAKAIQANLEHSCECQIWSQGLFGLSEGTLETLVNSLEKFDFAILAVTSDDITTGRDGEVSKSPRDNVIFELGLFIGGLGRNRVFFVIDREARAKLPSDLAGITPGTYVKPIAGNYRSALGTACTEIEEKIQSIRVRNGHYKLRITFDYKIDKSSQSLEVEVDNEDSRPLPSFGIRLRNPSVIAPVRIASQEHRDLLPTQYRTVCIPLIKCNGTLRQLVYPHFATTFPGRTIGQGEWIFEILLDQSNTVFYESKDIGNALAALIYRVNKVKDFDEIEPDIWRAL